MVTTAAASVSGYTTYTLTASLHDTAANLYSIEGTSDGRMEIPPAYQVAAPFGCNLGGVDPGFVSVLASAQYDSWLTVGIIDGNSGQLASVGIEFGAWSETTGLSIDDGSVFWMQPNDAPGGDVVVAQLTVPIGSSGTVTMGMQGHATGGGDWDVHSVVFAYPTASPCEDSCAQLPAGVNLCANAFSLGGVDALLICRASIGAARGNNGVCEEHELADAGCYSERRGFGGSCGCASGTDGCAIFEHNPRILTFRILTFRILTFFALCRTDCASLRACDTPAASMSCTDPISFESLLGPVNAACCDEPDEDCSSGFPATCNAGCAALLLPLQAACADFLASVSMRETRALIERAVQTC